MNRLIPKIFSIAIEPMKIPAIKRNTRSRLACNVEASMGCKSFDAGFFTIIFPIEFSRLEEKFGPERSDQNAPSFGKIIG